jgi:hypothetical protein
MLKKLPKKGLNVILIASMIGLGTFSYIPIVFAESVTTVQVNPTTNKLANLEIDGIKLDKDFSADIKEYSTEVENEVYSINLLVESSNLNSVITINSQVITNGSASSYSLQTGDNTFLITVNDGKESESTYTLIVTRKQNANPLLQTIKLSTGELSPSFSAVKTEYTAQVTNATTTIKVSPATIEKTATVAVNGLLATKEGVIVNLPVGKSTIHLVVTAENGEKKTYTLQITRAAGQGSLESKPTEDNTNITKGSQESRPTEDNTNNPKDSQESIPTQNKSIQGSSLQQSSGTVEKVSKAKLSSLAVSIGTWDSTFSSNEFTYHVAVASDVETITINPTVSYSDSTILIEGSTSKTIQLEDDNKTIISVVVTNGDDDQKTYVLVFDKAE